MMPFTLLQWSGKFGHYIHAPGHTAPGTNQLTYGVPKMNNVTFKGYSSKSAATKAATKAGVEVLQVEGKWGIMVPTTVTLAEAQAEAATDREAEGDRTAPAGTNLTELSETGYNGHCPHCGINHIVNGTGHHGDEVNGKAITHTTGMYACLACGGEWGPTPPPDRKIEQDRPTQNGVTRPSAGGLCRAVWDLCDTLRDGNAGACPTVAQVRAAAPATLNPANVQIEYYQWRKFNGYRGRLAKPATATAEG